MRSYFFGLAAALGIAWIVVAVRQHFTQEPEAQASAGMYAAGDAMLGIAVFGLLSLLPLPLGLYWLRSVDRFWPALTFCSTLYMLSGFAALVVSGWLWLRDAAGTRAFAADARIGTMPFSALALLMCAIFAPQIRQRWLLLAAGLSDGVIFTVVVLVKLILPGLPR